MKPFLKKENNILAKEKDRIVRHRHKGIAICLCLALSLAMAGCGTAPEDPALRPSPEPSTKVLTLSPSQTVVAYFLDSEGKNLVPLSMQTNETREVAFVALQKLLAGAPNDFVQSPLPAGIKAKDLYLEKGVICVELTEEFLQTAPEQIDNSLRCIVATVGWAAPEKQVNILVNHQLVEKIGDKAISQPLSYTPINPADSSVKTDSPIVQVYFSDNQAMYLTPVSYCRPEGDVYTFVMKKLTEGPPKQAGLVATLYKGTKLNSVTVSDGTAKVDLSKEAVAYGGGTAFEYLFVQSILATFAQFPEVETVQFFIDGEPYDLLPEGTDIEMPLPVNKTVNYILNQE